MIRPLIRILALPAPTLLLYDIVGMHSRCNDDRLRTCSALIILPFSTILILRYIKFLRCTSPIGHVFISTSGNQIALLKLSHNYAKDNIPVRWAKGAIEFTVDIAHNQKCCTNYICISEPALELPGNLGTWGLPYVRNLSM